MINLDNVLGSRDIALPTKVHLVKAMVFPVVMCGCESWAIKKVEHWRIDAFELLCWRRLFRVPWTIRRSNQSIWKEISPECSLEGLMLNLKLQYFGHLMWTTDSFQKTLMLGKIKTGGEGDNRGEMVGWHHCLDGLVFEQALGVDDGHGSLCADIHGVAKSGTQLRGWTEWMIGTNGNCITNASTEKMEWLFSLVIMTPSFKWHFCL